MVDQNIPAAPPKQHVIELQTIRGLAALTVAVGHVSLVYAMPAGWRVTFDLILNQHAAVVLFFVLSGYVLSASLLRQPLNASDLTAYYVRRIFRIYPAIWVVTGFSALVILVAGGGTVFPAASEWFQGRMIPSLLTIRNVVLGLGAVRSDLIPPLWTIFIELVGSAFLPVFVLVAYRRPAAMIPLLIGLAVLPFQMRDHLNALAYLPFFAAGVALHIMPGTLKRVIERHAVAIVIVAGAGLVLFRSIWSFVNFGRLEPIAAHYHAPVPSLAEGVASTLLIAAVAVSAGKLGALGRGALVRLGDISYSLYLIHFPVLTLLSRLLTPMFERLGIGAPGAVAFLLLPTILLTVPLSALVYRFVETPGIAAGRRVVSALGIRTGTRRDFQANGSATR